MLQLTDAQLRLVMRATRQFAPRARVRMVAELAERLPDAPTDIELQDALASLGSFLEHARAS